MPISLPPMTRGGVLWLGEFFFRWRSYLPLALLPFTGIAIREFHHPLVPPLLDSVWEIACVLLGLGGWVLRFYTAGVIAPGTSGRHTRSFKAAALNTTGPYSVVRHPFYLGNVVIVVAFALFPKTWSMAPVVILSAIGYYACIARREEGFLRQRFGEAFERWAAQVPAMVPNPTLWVPANRRFNWVVAVRREFYTLAEILIVPLVLDLGEDIQETGTVMFDPVWAPVAVFGGVLFLAIRFLKKRTSLLPARPV